MASVIVVEAADGQFVDDAAQIWAEATAKRDNDPEVAPLTLARPVIEAVLGSSRRSRLLVALDSTGQVVGFAAIEPSAGDSAVAELRYLGVLPSLWGSGVATALLAALPRSLSAAGCTNAVLSVYIDNHAAIVSYVHAGCGFLSETPPPITVLHGSNSDTGSILGRPNDRWSTRTPSWPQMSPVIVVRPMGDPADLTGCTLTVAQCAVLNGLGLALVVGRVFGSRAVKRSRTVAVPIRPSITGH